MRKAEVGCSARVFVKLERPGVSLSPAWDEGMMMWMEAGAILQREFSPRGEWGRKIRGGTLEPGQDKLELLCIG